MQENISLTTKFHFSLGKEQLLSLLRRLANLTFILPLSSQQQKVKMRRAFQGSYWSLRAPLSVSFHSMSAENINSREE